MQQQRTQIYILLRRYSYQVNGLKTWSLQTEKIQLEKGVSLFKKYSHKLSNLFEMVDSGIKATKEFIEAYYDLQM